MSFKNPHSSSLTFNNPHSNLNISLTCEQIQIQSNPGDDQKNLALILSRSVMR